MSLTGIVNSSQHIDNGWSNLALVYASSRELLCPCQVIRREMIAVAVALIFAVDPIHPLLMVSRSDLANNASREMTLFVKRAQSCFSLRVASPPFSISLSLLLQSVTDIFFGVSLFIRHRRIKQSAREREPASDWTKKITRSTKTMSKISIVVL